jgi:hypothetical protein
MVFSSLSVAEAQYVNTIRNYRAAAKQQAQMDTSKQVL